MFWAFKQLCAPLRYLRIAQGESFIYSKNVYDWILPGTLSAITIFFIYLLRISMDLFSATGLVAGVVNLLNLLIAFFIAALAAVATFDRRGLDDAMKGHPATLKLHRNTGALAEHTLTHRQFICYLFGYLAFSSLCFLIFIHFVRFFGPRIITTAPAEFLYVMPYIRFGFILIFFFMLWQIIVTMFLGIYFLCDRLQVLDDPGR